MTFSPAIGLAAVAALVAIAGFMLARGHKVLRIVLGTLSICAVFVLVWGAVQPPPPPPATPTPAASGLYDDFNNPAYDGKINTTIWESFQVPNCDIQQQEGVAAFSLNALSRENTSCYLLMLPKLPFTKVGSVEAKLLGENNAQGDYSLEAIEYKTTGFQPDTLWLAQCGIVQTPKENKVELFFYLNNSYPKGKPETTITMPVSAKQWYTLRLQLDEYGAGIWCFANDKVLASFSPSRMDFLKSQIFSRHLVGYWSANSSGTYQADDVYVKP